MQQVSTPNSATSPSPTSAPTSSRSSFNFGLQQVSNTERNSVNQQQGHSSQHKAAKWKNLQDDFRKNTKKQKVTKKKWATNEQNSNKEDDVVESDNSDEEGSQRSDSDQEDGSNVDMDDVVKELVKVFKKLWRLKIQQGVCSTDDARKELERLQMELYTLQKQ